MNTVTIQIGNSDDKLSQRVWADYVATCDQVIHNLVHEVHFFATSSNVDPWQNACWVVTVKDDSAAHSLRDELANKRALFDQDSIAWTAGLTLFI
jgi:hypothetical protein